jgi:hypothetical protein
VDFLMAVAKRHLENGRFMVVRRFADSLRSQGRISPADLLLGDTLAAEGRWRDAARIWERHDAPPFMSRRARAAFKDGNIVATASLLSRMSEAQRSTEDDLLYALALAGSERSEQALIVLESTRDETDPAAGTMVAFVESLLLAEADRTEPAAAARRSFETRLDELRRCLERDGCREVMNTLVGWSRAAPRGISPERWEELRRALYTRVTRPIPLFLRGMTKLWLGEDAAARAALRTYLKLLPAPDPRSRAHALLSSAGES